MADATFAQIGRMVGWPRALIDLAMPRLPFLMLPRFLAEGRFARAAAYHSRKRAEVYRAFHRAVSRHDISCRACLADGMLGGMMHTRGRF